MKWVLLGAAAATAAAVGTVVARKVAGPPELVRADELAKLTPRLTAAQRAAYLPLLNAALAQWEINTVPRIAAALGQWLLESNQFANMTEIAPDTERYARNASLGNGGSGATAAAYIGRGPVQLTGLYNYTQATKALGPRLGVDLVKNPELAADPRYGFEVAAWFWRRGTSTDLNVLADKPGGPDVVTITRRINGGEGHLDRRQQYTAQALAVLNTRKT